MRRALEELLVHFPTYRIYARAAGASAADARDLAWAMTGARRTLRAADRSLLDLIGSWVSGEGLRDSPPGPAQQERLRAMVRFQQLSAPTAAKTVEETAFYRYGHLLSRNEVGSDPGEFALSPAAFHAAMEKRRRRFPRGLLATAMRDHKRGEGMRARLAVLSKLPEAWGKAVARWERLNAPLKHQVHGAPVPDAAGAHYRIRLEGPAATHALAFARVHEGRAVVVAVARLVAALLPAEAGSTAPLNVARSAWNGTTAVLPRLLHGRRLVNSFVGDGQAGEAERTTGRIPLGTLFASLPVALLEAR
jgi:maltooligosyltrehalose synthase